MALKRSTVGRFTGTFTTDKTYDVRNIDVSRGANVTTSQHSGLPENTGAAVTSAVASRVTFDMGVGQALDVLGLGKTEFGTSDTAEFVLGNITGGSIDSGSTHTKWNKATNALATAYIEGFSVSEGGEGVANCVCWYWSADGSSVPLEDTGSSAFPTLTTVPDIHTVGPLTVNGSQIEGVTSISYSSGISIAGVVTDGLMYAQGGYPTSFDRRISVSVIDPVGVETALGDDGVKIASTTTVVLYKTNNDIPTATGAKTLTIAAGYVAPTSFSGTHGGAVAGGCVIYPTSSDGTTVPIAIS